MQNVFTHSVAVGPETRLANFPAERFYADMFPHYREKSVCGATNALLPLLVDEANGLGLRLGRRLGRGMRSVLDDM